MFVTTMMMTMMKLTMIKTITDSQVCNRYPGIKCIDLFFSEIHAVPALESWRPPGVPLPLGDGSEEGAVPPLQKIFEFFT